jgi:hypothetical protein
MEESRGFKIEILGEGEWFVARGLDIEVGESGRTRAKATS